MPGMTGGATAVAPVARYSVDLGDWINALAWDPDGLQVAAACADGQVAVIDTRSGRLAELARHTQPATHLAWSTTGALASASQDGTVLIDGDRRVDLQTKAWPQDLRWRPDGQRLAVATGRHVQLLDGDGDPLATSEAADATVTSLAWSAKGTELAAGSYGGVRILNGRSLRSDRTLAWKGSVLALALSPDGRRLAHGNQDSSVHFWDLRKDTELEMMGYETKVQQLSWRRDSRLLATGGGTNVTVWDFAGRGPAGSRPLELKRHEHPVSWIDFSPRSDVLATTAYDGLLLLWNPPAAEPVAGVEIDDALTCAAWSPDGTQIAVGGTDGTVAIIALG